MLSGGSEDKASARQEGDPGSIPELLGRSLEKEMANHSSILAWRIPWTEEPGGLQSTGSHRVKRDWSDLAAAAGKTTRPFRYNLNQISYDYTVKVTNRLKGLNLIECLKNYGWRFVTLYKRQGSRPPTRKSAKGKMVIWEGLTNSWEKEKLKAEEKRKDIPIWIQSSKE